LLLKVVLTNKTQDQDLKVWYRLTAQDGVDPASINVSLHLTSRKLHLFSKNQKVIETVIKVDPTKPYFFKDIKDAKVVIEAVIRNEGGAKTAGTTGARAVHYGGQTNDNDIGVGPDNDFDDVDRDDTGAYGRYQEAPQYDGYQGAPQEEEITKLLHL